MQQTAKSFLLLFQYFFPSDSGQFLKVFVPIYSVNVFGLQKIIMRYTETLILYCLWDTEISSFCCKSSNPVEANGIWIVIQAFSHLTLNLALISSPVGWVFNFMTEMIAFSFQLKKCLHVVVSRKWRASSVCYTFFRTRNSVSWGHFHSDGEEKQWHKYRWFSLLYVPLSYPQRNPNDINWLNSSK